MLHDRANMLPINQLIYHRSKDIWDKISSGTAGDVNSFQEITSIEMVRPHCNFPSSYLRSQMGEPPPIFTGADGSSPTVKAYYD